MGEVRNAYRVLVGKCERTGPLLRPRRRWQHKNTMDLREIVWEAVDWMNLAQDRDK
jgi:hypothetical protein